MIRNRVRSARSLNTATAASNSAAAGILSNCADTQIVSPLGTSGATVLDEGAASLRTHNVLMPPPGVLAAGDLRDVCHLHHVAVLRVLGGVALSILVLWLVFLLALTLLLPSRASLADARRLIPDMIGLLRGLSRDETLPRRVRRRLALLLGYLALPFDLVPDFIPLLGYADDVIALAWVLRSVVRAAGPAALERHWHGAPSGLAVVRRLTGLS